MNLLEYIEESDALKKLKGHLTSRKIFEKRYQPYELTSIEIIDDLYTKLTFAGYCVSCGGDVLDVLLIGTQLDDGEFSEVYYSYSPDKASKWHSIIDGVDKLYYMTKTEIINTRVWKRTGT